MSEDFDTLDEDTAEATEQSARSAFQVLKSLEGDAFNQVVKYRKYVASAEKRIERLKACLSDDAVALLAQFPKK
jgi:hypothetical protein